MRREVRRRRAAASALPTVLSSAAIQQVADDHLIVPGGLGLRVLVDGLRDDRRLGGGGPGIVRRGRQSRPRQAHPQLGGARIPFPYGTGLVRELEALVGERMQLYVRPRRQAVPVAEAERLPGPFGLDGEGPERIGHLFLLHAAPERDGTQVVAVQPPRELPEHGMLGVGSHTLDHELVAGHAEGDRRSILEQQRRAPGQPRRRRRERRVPFGIHGVLVHGDRQLDQEIGEVARQGRAFRGARTGERGRHGPR